VPEPVFTRRRYLGRRPAGVCFSVRCRRTLDRALGAC
jgi:hypothetical protein